MKLREAQKVLFDLLTPEERQNHIAAYKQAKNDLENGITKTLVGASAPTDHVKVAPNAPSALYLEEDETLTSQPNIVGEVLRNPEGKMIVVFDSKDIITLLELYYGNNILNV